MATLYAQPTKEWVIPAKPKPGRKPKRDEPAEEEDGGSDFKAKKVQNRAAQRAFRERKQSQLADLQARLTQYEQGEIERNVALQNVAKKLKEENERLKSDNEKLREEGDRVRQENMLMRTRLRELQEEFSAYKRSVDPSSQLELDAFISTNKRTRTESGASSNAGAAVPSPATSSNPPAAKRKRTKDDGRSSTPVANARGLSFSEARRTATKGYSTLPPDYAPPPQPTFVYSPTSTDTSSRPSLMMSPASDGSSTAEPLSFDATSPHEDATIRDFGSDLESTSDNLNVVDCGFCSKEPDECVCRAVSMDINQLIGSASASTSTSLRSSLGTTGNATSLAAPSTSSSSPTARSSILDNLPPVQPGVPLKLRRSKQLGASTSANLLESEPIHLTPVPQLAQLRTESEPSSRPVCSGDPSNCAACADDSFGRAFCTALANGGKCRDDNCMRCPKNSRLSSSTTTATTEGDGKEQPVPMDVDGGPSSGLGLGVGMSMETGMLLCCGDPKLCGGGGCGIRTSSSPMKAPRSQQLPFPTTAPSSVIESHTHAVADIEDVFKDHARLPPFTAPRSEGEDASKHTVEYDIPTNEAWARLKAHPNVAFADLALLADVVARRTKCTGPRVLLSPTPEEKDKTHNEEDAAENVEESMSQCGGEAELGLPTKLVPHTSLVRCGRERLLRVQAEGVRDALAMLDVQRPV